MQTNRTQKCVCVIKTDRGIRDRVQQAILRNDTKCNDIVHIAHTYNTY